MVAVSSGSAPTISSADSIRATKSSTAGCTSTHPPPNRWTLPAPSCSSTAGVPQATSAIPWVPSITMGSVHPSEPPPALVRGLSGHPVGLVLLARLAVDASRHGKGLGALLLTEALRKAALAGEVVAARLVVVDAIEEIAARSYTHHGFIAGPGVVQFTGSSVRRRARCAPTRRVAVVVEVRR